MGQATEIEKGIKTGKRLGFVGIIIEEREKSASSVNNLLSEMAHIVVARVGIPYRERGCAVITLVVDATTDEIGALTGRLGKIPGVSVKSGLSSR
ncbi:MAG: CopG family transcriptional regulator [Lentisphaerae bacterium]|jgi:putative iron-only hydrogenase system regulator|nr:CopG family transcriptional regulator [Lentisphaerota bacterium]